MPRHAAPQTASQPSVKRQRQMSADDDVPPTTDQDPSADIDSSKGATGDPNTSSTTGGVPGQSSNFRSVSACNRCRQRKNRCDQKLPSCATCERAGVNCVGFDPITKNEVPRSYVYYLETRVQALEQLLSTNNISYPAAQYLGLCSRPTAETASVPSVAANNATRNPTGQPLAVNHHAVAAIKSDGSERSPAMVNIVSSAKPRSLAAASGVSFARVVLAAVQHSVSDNGQAFDRSQGVTTMRDSFFGLHTKPNIQPAPIPRKAVASKLISLYFEHANPQIPILHRVDFLRMFERAYESGTDSLSARELYMLNMVFAIGSGVIVGEPVKPSFNSNDKTLAQMKDVSTPEEYHASAIVHLEACLSQSGGYLEVLQAILLLANFALLRPVPPGLWYITGVAVRLAVDLGLHHEEGGDLDIVHPTGDPQLPDDGAAQGRGRRLWIRDMRRRLFWCTYSFDRLVSTCVGRPFGISDQVITTSLPSLLDDKYISTDGFIDTPADSNLVSYKRVAHHYFRLRMLQSEILQVLQHNHAQSAREGNAPPMYPEMHGNLPCPFLSDIDSFYSWRAGMDDRLLAWKEAAPSREETDVAFSTEFLELNYWQAIIMLYRQSLSVPVEFRGEYNTSNEVNSPSTYTAEPREDEDRIYMKIAEAGQKILRIYRKLHIDGLVSYTYLSTHHLFMAGISYLYALWHSQYVRSRFTMDDVDFTVLAAKSVLNDMIDKCPPAETCRDAFDRTAKATIKMASRNGGFRVHKTKPRKQRGRAATSGSLDLSNSASLALNTTNTAGGDATADSQTQKFTFSDFSNTDNLSSPGLSTAGDISNGGTPPMSGTNDAFRRPSGISPGDLSGSQDATSMNQSHTSSPALVRAMTGQASDGFSNQPFSAQGLRDNADGSLDLLQNMGAGSNGDFGTLDPMDLGYGMPWDGVNNDFTDGSSTFNPFGPFFFGGPPNGNV